MRLSKTKLAILNHLANNHDKLIISQTNTGTNIVSGTLISIPKQHTLEEPHVTFDE